MAFGFCGSDDFSRQNSAGARQLLIFPGREANRLLESPKKAVSEDTASPHRRLL
jgi:hypothetical protein